MGESGVRDRGGWGEALVAEYLRERGGSVLASRYRCRFGEIDLIARVDDVLCFVEVKVRSSLRCGLPREAVTESKRRRLRATAAWYLSTHDPDAVCRFDVAEVYTDAAQSPERTRIEYLENAFT